MLSVSVGLCVWSMVIWVSARRIQRKTSQVLADARAAVDRSAELLADLKRHAERSEELHEDSIRLLAEADQLASRARDELGEG